MPRDLHFYSGLSDEFLFKLVQQDDKNAFSEIYNRYWSFLLEHAFKPLQSQAKAEDIVQEIFISLYQRRKTMEQVVSLKAYLYKALKFKVLNEFRSQMVRDQYQKHVFLNNSCKIDFIDAIDARKMEQVIDRSVEQLPEKCRNTFLLSRQENLSYKSISGQLQISVSTVEKHISKALKSVKANLHLYL